MKMKKIASFLLSLTMLTSVLPMNVSAASEPTVRTNDRFVLYDYSDSPLNIVAEDGEGSAVIGEIPQGFTYASIGYTYSNVNEDGVNVDYIGSGGTYVPFAKYDALDVADVPLVTAGTPAKATLNVTDLIANSDGPLSVYVQSSITIDYIAFFKSEYSAKNYNPTHQIYDFSTMTQAEFEEFDSIEAAAGGEATLTFSDGALKVDSSNQYPTFSPVFETIDDTEYTWMRIEWKPSAVVENIASVATPIVAQWWEWTSWGTNSKKEAIEANKNYFDHGWYTGTESWKTWDKDTMPSTTEWNKTVIKMPRIYDNERTDKYFDGSVRFMVHNINGGNKMSFSLKSIGVYTTEDEARGVGTEDEIPEFVPPTEPVVTPEPPVTPEPEPENPTYQVYDFSTMTQDTFATMKAEGRINTSGGEIIYVAPQYDGAGLGSRTWNKKYQNTLVKFDKMDAGKDTWVKICYTLSNKGDSAADISNIEAPVVVQWNKWSAWRHNSEPQTANGYYLNGYYNGTDTWTEADRPKGESFHELVLRVPKITAKADADVHDNMLRVLLQTSSADSTLAVFKYIGLFSSKEDAENYDPSIAGVTVGETEAVIDPIKRVAVFPEGTDISNPTFEFYSTDVYSGKSAATSIATSGNVVVDTASGVQYREYQVYSMDNKMKINAMTAGTATGELKTWTVFAGDPDEVLIPDEVEDPYADVESASVDPDSQTIELVRKIGSNGYLMDFSNAGATQKFVNKQTTFGDTKFDYEASNTMYAGLRGIEYGGHALQLQSWITNDAYMEFNGTKDLRSTHPYVKIMYDVSNYNDGVKIKLGREELDTSARKKYISAVVNVTPTWYNNGDLRITFEGEGDGTFINIKYLAFFKTQAEADAFDQTVIGARMADTVCDIDQINHKITAVLPENLSEDEMLDLTNEFKLALFDSQCDYAKAVGNGYTTDQSSVITEKGTFAAADRKVSATYTIKNMEGEDTVWTIEGTSAGEAPVNNSAVQGAASKERYAKIDTENKQIIFRAGDITAVVLELTEGAEVTDESYAYRDGTNYAKDITVTVNDVPEVWKVIIPDTTDITYVLEDTSIIATATNKPENAKLFVAVYIGDNLVKVGLDRVDDISGSYTAKIMLWDGMSPLEDVIEFEHT